MSAGPTHNDDRRMHSPRRRAIVLLLLFVACAVPRIAMAIRLDTISSDGAFYIQKAREIELGTRTEAVDKYDLNIYPLVLAWFHRAGWNWETAAETWGVLCASLTVLPLYGWLRRQFNHRLALLSCLLYAFHPKLIEWTPEVLRESTFWLLFTTSLYLYWRAAHKGGLPWFLLAGITTTLAIHTRFEGWFLLIPAAWWCLSRWLAADVPRWKLAGGTCLIAAGYPLTMMGLTLAFGYSQWEWGAFHRVEMAVRWLFPDAEDEEPDVAPATSQQQATARAAEPAVPAATADQATAESLAVTDDPSGDDAERAAAQDYTVASPAAMPSDSQPAETPPMTVANAAGTVLRVAVRGFGYVYMALMLAGAVAGFRRWFRSDYLPLLLVAAVTVGAIAIHVWGAYLASSRYVLSLVILTTPIAATGLLAICTWLAEGVRRADGVVQAKIARQMSRRTLRFGLAIFALVGVIDAVSSSDQGREAKAIMGNWIRREFGSGAQVAGSWNWTLSAYYADAQYQTLPDCPFMPSDTNLVELVQSMRAKVVMVSPKWPARREFIEHALNHGYRVVPASEIPKICRGKLIVLAQDRSRMVQAEATRRN